MYCFLRVAGDDSLECYHNRKRVISKILKVLNDGVEFVGGLDLNGFDCHTAAVLHNICDDFISCAVDCGIIQYAD